MAEARHYYKDEYVRQRIADFLGGREPDGPTAVFVCGKDGMPGPNFPPQPVSDLPQHLDAGLEVMRSPWDRRALIAHIDIDYVNFSFPDEPFMDPARTSDVMQPKDKIFQAAQAAAILGVRHFVIRPGPERGGYPKSERIGRVGNAANILTDVAHRLNRSA
jgi:hypothetical protein